MLFRSLDAAHPAFALITAGPDNMYGYPHPDVVRRLEERRVAAFRTDRHGLVSFRTDGRRLRVDAAAWAASPGGLYSAF